MNKKADYVPAFSNCHKELIPLYRQLSLRGDGLALSHMNGTYNERQPIFCGVEVKQPSDLTQESLAQLII